MSALTIGVDLDDFRLPTKEALHKAAELDFRAVEFATVAGELAPGQLSASGRRHLTRLADGLGLGIAALVADVPGLRLTDPRTVEERVSRTCQILDLATDLKVPLVTASAGVLTDSATGDPSPLAIEALQRIGEHADSRGRVYAVRPSGDRGEGLARILGEVGCPSIGVGLDPAALVMAETNPLQMIAHVAGRIPLVHVRDGTAGIAERAGRETRLGEGDVDWIGVLAGLSAADYSGAYILRRTDSQTPAADIAQAENVFTGMLPAG